MQKLRAFSQSMVFLLFSHLISNFDISPTFLPNPMMTGVFKLG